MFLYLFFTTVFIQQTSSQPFLSKKSADIRKNLSWN